MFNKIIFSPVFLAIFILLFAACKPDEDVDTIAPLLISGTVADGASDVELNRIISFNYNEKIALSSTATILLNDVAVSATVNSQTLTVAATLSAGTTYTLIIPGNAVSDAAGNYAKEIKIIFTTKGVSNINGVYEAEKAVLTGGAAIAFAQGGYSGTGYVNTNAGDVTFTVQVTEAGYYDVLLNYMATAPKVNYLYVDGAQAAEISFPTTTAWAETKAAMLKLTAGTHTIALVKSWGYIQLDYLKLAKNTVGPVAFNIVSAPVTPNPLAQLSNLYNFLKTNFGTKIISGTMAAHSTNINEATWVHTNTGKWPAFTFFDFIDHTNPNQNWVKYNDPFTLGQDWWNNNGVVGFSWHWRDPLTKSGSFSTSETTFDVLKATDTNSAEYKAMIADIDVIAGYLKPFKNADIPVIWRPLHEAEGGWFWWGAKGAEPCKALWRLMFDRLVNYHGLNNLLWVWTTSASPNAAAWYPGDEYVDILGMDIYPGANQHGSQYISFNKVREFTAGKKMITLSECGSVPDPALMMEYGDTWSWFMPWNGDYTESASHNGATWWKKFFSYDYVITRDKMPSLK
ncbi:MAG: glycosyl hydrolase [Paludibacter sp.]